MTKPISQAKLSDASSPLSKTEKNPSSHFYKTLLDSLFDAVYTINANGAITYWNDSCRRLTGYTQEDMIGQTYVDTPFAYDFSEEQTQIQRTGILNVLQSGMSGTWKGFILRKNGQRIPVESRISPLLEEEGQIIGAVEILRDISSQVALEQAHRQVLQVSRKDKLTGLYNRSTISELLKAEIERSRRYRQPLSLIMADIDLFKRINDTYGHDAGDKVLAKIGAILFHNLRKPDAVGRWGGEEFLIIAPGNHSQAASQLAERIRLILQEIPQGEFPSPVTMSFGVAELRENQGHDQLIFQADMALYEAKHQGRDRVVMYSDSIQSPSTV